MVLGLEFFYTDKQKRIESPDTDTFIYRNLIHGRDKMIYPIKKLTAYPYRKK